MLWRNQHKIEPQEGFEPPTPCLQDRRSNRPELLRRKKVSVLRTYTPELLLANGGVLLLRLHGQKSTVASAPNQ